jgi:glycosyltransferase involved in cell wall biosynthesis
MIILCIIPAYNAARYIKGVITGILQQDYKKIEVVVVDDCSQDNTADIAEALGVEVIRLKKNIGKFNAVNVVLNKKKIYHFFYVHDADDISYRHHFSSLVRPMIENTNIHMTFCNYRRMDFHTGQLSEPIVGKKCTMALYRKTVFNKIGYYDDTRFGGDTEYWERFLKYFSKKNMYHVDSCLANCIFNGDNLTFKYNMELRRKYVAEFRERHKNLNKYNFKQYTPKN